jgi:hypothetical protein
MNKHLLMIAAAILGSTPVAIAAVDKKSNSGVQSVYSTATMSGNAVTFCDAVTMAWNGVYDEIIDQETGCGTGFTGVFGVGNGIDGKTKDIGYNTSVSDSIEATNLAQLNLDFGTTSKGAPTNGGEFAAYATLITTSGAVETFEMYAGHYYFGTPLHKTGYHPAISAKLVHAANLRTPVVKGLSAKK